MSQTDPPPMPAPVQLDYARPVRTTRVRTFVIGIIATVIYAVSAGLVAYGLMLYLQRFPDAAEFVASGITGMILATGLIITAWLSRR